MEKVFVSACLMGEKVRYDGQDATRKSKILDQWREEGRIITACPEVEGGLPTPRNPSEIKGKCGVKHADGRAVLSGKAHVVMNDGTDVTAAFMKGAEHVLRLCKENGIQMAVLKDKSPSNGVTRIYDGSFTSKKIDGMGVTAALLRENGIAVFSDEDLESAEKHLRKLEKAASHKPRRHTM